MLASLLLILFARQTAHRRPRRRAGAFRPRVAGLEDRAVPAITTVTQDFRYDTATITTYAVNDSADNITITDPGTGPVTVRADSLSVPLELNVHTIRLFTNGGNDTVRYDLTTTTGFLSRSLRLEVDLGDGNDTFAADLHGTNIQSASTLDFKVLGGWGSDNLTVNAAGTDTNHVNIRPGSTLRMELIGGNDFDPFDGGDTINVNYTGNMDGNLILKAAGGQGNDAITALVTLTGGSAGHVKGDGSGAARVEGGQGADVLDFRVRDHSGGSADVSAEVDAGLDWDTDIARHTTNVRAVNAFGSEDRLVT